MTIEHQHRLPILNWMDTTLIRQVSVEEALLLHFYVKAQHILKILLLFIHYRDTNGSCKQVDDVLSQVTS